MGPATFSKLFDAACVHGKHNPVGSRKKLEAQIAQSGPMLPEVQLVELQAAGKGHKVKGFELSVHVVGTVQYFALCSICDQHGVV